MKPEKRPTTREYWAFNRRGRVVHPTERYYCTNCDHCISPIVNRKIKKCKKCKEVVEWA